MHVQWESDGTVTIDERVIAQVDRPFWRERADLVIEGEPWLFRKESGDLVGEAQGQRRLAATKTSFWSNRWQVQTTTGSVLEVKKAGMFSSGYVISTAAGEVAEVRSRSFFGVRPEADLPDGVPAADAVFVLWVCFILMRRDSSSAASSSSS